MAGPETAGTKPAAAGGASGTKEEAKQGDSGTKVAEPKKEEEKKKSGEKADEDKEKEKKAPGSKALDAKHEMEMADRGKYQATMPSRPVGYGAEYMTSDWAVKTISNVDNPTTLAPAAWKAVSESNRMCHGFVVTPQGLVKRARFPAFQLKSNRTPAGVPDFEVFDNASIVIKESKDSLESSFIHNGFSSTAVSVAASASYSGLGGSAGLSFSGAMKEERDNSITNTTLSEHKDYTAVYSFPRARVYLDSDNLELTETCTKELATLIKVAKEAENATNSNKQDPDEAGVIKKAQDELKKFCARFGMMFATEFLLGGQLSATKSASSIGASDSSTARDAMKQSAALSIGGKIGGFSAEVNASASRENQDSKSITKTSASSVSALAWSARGGNTLLCLSPSEWSNSLASFQTWRTVEQDGIVPIQELMDKVSESKNREATEAFNKILRRSFLVKAPNPTGTWRGRIRLETTNGRKLVMNKDGKIQLAPASSPAEEVLFSVWNGDISQRDIEPSLPELKTQVPLILTTGLIPLRNASHKQIPGIWANKDGEILPENGQKICRWSFRKDTDVEDFSRQWFGDQGQKLKHDDQVRLCCHSHVFGAYPNHFAAPWGAPSVFSKNDEVRVHGLDIAAMFTPPTASNIIRVSTKWYKNDASLDWMKATYDDNRKLIEFFDTTELNEKSAEGTKLLAFRDWFGFNASTVDRFNNSYGATQSQILPPNTQVGDFDRLRRIAPRSRFEDCMAEWEKSTDFKTEVIFKVKFV